MPGEEEYVHRHRQGLAGEVRVRKIYETYFPILLQRAVAMAPDREKAEQMVLDIFIKLFRNPSICPPYEEAGPYLRVALKNASNDAWTLYNKNKDQEKLLAQRPADAPERDPEAIMISMEVEEMIWQLVEELPEGRRNVIKLSIEGYKTHEIAQKLNIEEQTVRNTRTKGRITLAIELVKRGVFLLLILKLPG